MISSKRINKDYWRKKLKKLDENIPIERKKFIPYDDTEEIMHYHRTNKKSTYLTQKMRDIKNRKSK